MIRRPVSVVRRIASFGTVGCLLGGAMVGGTIFVSAGPASAACVDTDHVNVDAYDATQKWYGNSGDIYVNTSDTISDSHNYINRSIFAAATTTSIKDDVEVGWQPAPLTTADRPCMRNG